MLAALDLCAHSNQTWTSDIQEVWLSQRGVTVWRRCYSVRELYQSPFSDILVAEDVDRATAATIRSAAASFDPLAYYSFA